MFSRCGKLVVCMLVFGLVCTTGVSFAGEIGLPDGWWDQDYHFCPDPSNDAEGGPAYEIFGIGYTIVDSYLFVCVDTNFPIGGTVGDDSYAQDTHFSPGDLYINVGGMFQMGNGFTFGVATTPNPPLPGDDDDDDAVSLAEDRTADPNDGPWLPILSAGDLLYGANFATGTLEDYATGTPSDGNDGDGVNDYPTLIMSYISGYVAGAYSGFHYDGSSYYYYVDIFEMDLLSEIYGGISLLDDQGNLENTIQLAWAMECGNDLAEYKVDIPEPTTVALLGAGVAALASRRRKNIL